MEYETIVLAPPVRGLDTKTEAVMLSPMYSPNLKNMIVTPTKLYKDLGYSLLGSNLPLGGIGQELIQFTDGIGTQHLMACTTTGVYAYDADSNRWRLLNPFNILDNCEANWDADAATGADAQATTFKVGSKAIKIVLASGDHSDGDMLASNDITEVDITGYSIFGCWVQSTIALAINALEFTICEDVTGAKTNDYVEIKNDIALVANTWYYLQVAVDLSDMNEAESVGLYLNSDTAFDAGCTIYVDDLRVFSAFTGGATDRWSHDIINDANEGWQNATAILLSNGTTDEPYTWDGQLSTGLVILDTDTDFSTLASVKEVAQHYDHLCFYDFNDSVQRVRSHKWTDIGDTNNWVTSGTYGEKILTDSRGKLQRAKRLRSDIVLYSDLSITTQRYVGSPDIFKHDTLVVETGLFAPKALWDSALVHYFLGTDQKFYMYAGGGDLLPFGQLVEEEFFANLSVADKASIVFGYDQGKHKLYIFYPDRTQTPADTYAQSYYALNIKDTPPTWEAGRLADTVRDFSVFSNQTEYTCDGIFFAGVSCDDDSEKSLMRCDLAIAQEAYPTAVFISSDGNVFQLGRSSGLHNATTIECIVETGDFTIVAGSQKTSFRAHEYSFNACCAESKSKTAEVSVYYSTDYGDTWSEFTESPVTLSTVWTEHRLQFDVKDTQVRWKYVQNSKTDFQLRGHSIKVTKETDRT